MATIFSHALVAISVAYVLKPKQVPPYYYTSCVLLSVLPDADVLGFRYGIAYGDLWGHRGLSHSISFALLFSLVWLWVQQRGSSTFVLSWKQANSWQLLGVYTLVMVSHGLLDMLTNGGLGVALFSPFENSRYFFPWHSIMVSPIGLHGWSWDRIRAIASNELALLVLPALLCACFAWILRQSRR